MVKCEGLRGLSVLILAILGAAVLLGCAGSVESDDTVKAFDGILRIGQEENGKQIKICKGGSLEIWLQENPSTGYVWKKVRLDEDILTMGEVESKRAGSREVDSGRTEPSEGNDLPGENHSAANGGKSGKNELPAAGEGAEEGKDGLKVGAPRVGVYRFHAVDIGETVVRLEYTQPWDKEAEPADVFEITVMVVSDPEAGGGTE